MILSFESKRAIALYLTAFILIGVLRIVGHPGDFLLCMPQLVCSVLVILWALTVQKRVTDTHLRRLLLSIVGFLLLFFLLQIARYDFFHGNIDVKRYLWYAYYIPLIALPLLSFYLSFFIHRAEDEPLPQWFFLPIIIGILLVIGMLTNDFHFWAISFPGESMSDDGDEKREWLYYLINAFIYGVYIISYGSILKKSYRFVEKKYRRIPAIPALIGVLYFVLYPLRIMNALFGFRAWNMGEVNAFAIIGTLEACIQVGMIPANMGYEKIFSASHLPAVILEHDKKIIYHTSAAYPFMQGKDVIILRQSIPGGSVEWAVDMKQIYKLNRQIAETTRQVQARNAYLAEENRIKKERTEIEIRNELYDKISEIIQPQLAKIEDLLSEEKGDIKKQLPQIAVLSAYIKRRCNMTLLAADGALTVTELAMAIGESLEYIRLCGVNTALSSIGTGSYPAEMIIAAYEHIQSIVEESLDSMTDMITTVRSEERRLTVRMMLKSNNFKYESNDLWEDSAAFSRKLLITKENDDIIIVLTFTEGGERA